MQKAPHVEAANSYARAVAAGRISAGKRVRQACQRHLDDLGKKRWRYTFDEARAEKACRFIELLPHTKGKWARSRELIRLEPWQCFFVCSVFGWVDRLTWLRRFRRALLLVPRKNGKSLLAAGIGLYMFCADGEHGAEVYSGATSEKQAWEVFRPARLMLLGSPDLKEATGAEAGAKTLFNLGDGSRFEPVIGKPGDGASPSCAIVDEYHEHSSDELYDTMLTGMGAREQPLMLVTTTAGADISGPCYALQQDAERVLDGLVEDDELFGLIYGIDEGDDWTTEAVLRKANPNFGISVTAEYLIAQQREAVRSARKQATFKIKHLDVWVTARNPYFNLEAWMRLADPALKEGDFADADLFGCLDLSSKKDLTAKVKLYRRMVGSVVHWYVFPRFWLPEAQTDGEDRAHYAGWAKDGHLELTDGNVIDYGAIRGDIQDDQAAHPYAALGYDPWGAAQLAQQLQDEDGIVVAEVKQNTSVLSEPMKWVDACIEAGTIHHDGNPVMTWCISNVTAKEDANENVFPRKERPENKIDGAVALIGAMAVAMSAPEAEGSIDDYLASLGV